MSVSRFPQITEELLSAYLDNRVSDEERRLIEHAIKVEPQIAWQLESLRQTVHMLQSLPALALPRTFTLDQVLLNERAAAEEAHAANRRVIKPAPVEKSWWQQWLAIWQSGNPYLRNAAAAALLLLVVLVAGNQLFSPQRQPANNTAALTSRTATAAEVAVLITTAAPDQVVAPENAPEAIAESTTATAATTARSLKNEAPQPQGAAPVVPSEDGGANSEPTVMANLPQVAASDAVPALTAAAPRQEFASAGNSGAAPANDSNVLRSGAAQRPGADQQPIDLAAAAGGSFGGSNVAAGQDPTMKQGSEVTAASVPETVTAVDAYTAPLTETQTASIASSDVQEGEGVIAAGASIAESNSLEATPTLTVTLTPTPTITPTSTLTATATLTVTLTPTTTPLSQGNMPPVQTMQLFAQILPTPQSEPSHWLMVLTLMLSLLWWRSRKTDSAID